jgi:hypothetical protein
MTFSGCTFSTSSYPASAAVEERLISRLIRGVLRLLALGLRDSGDDGDLAVNHAPELVIVANQALATARATQSGTRASGLVEAGTKAGDELGTVTDNHGWILDRSVEVNSVWL